MQVRNAPSRGCGYVPCQQPLTKPDLRQKYCTTEHKLLQRSLDRVAAAALRPPRGKRIFEELPEDVQAYFLGKRGTAQEVVAVARKHQQNYALSLEDYFEMQHSSGDRCFICRRREHTKLGETVKLLAVDHDHSRTRGEAGYVRGLLCYRCNARLGNLERDGWEHRAALYLARARPQLVPPLSRIPTPRNLRELGITENQYRALEASQAGKCAICRQPEREVHRQSGAVKRLAVDHDHAVEVGAGGCIRGLLCSKCNTRLSDFENPHWRPLADAYRAAAASLAAGELPCPAWDLEVDELDLDTSSLNVQRRRARQPRPPRPCRAGGCTRDIGHLADAAEFCSKPHRRDHEKVLRTLARRPVPCARAGCPESFVPSRSDATYCPPSASSPKGCKVLAREARRTAERHAKRVAERTL